SGFFICPRGQPCSTLFPYTTLFRSVGVDVVLRRTGRVVGGRLLAGDGAPREQRPGLGQLAGAAPRRRQHLVPEPQRAACHPRRGDRKSTRLNSSHVKISYAVFCLKK